MPWQRMHERELEEQADRAEDKRRFQERAHKQKVEQLTRSYEAELADAQSIFWQFDEILGRVPGIASQRRATEVFNERARFII